MVEDESGESSFFSKKNIARNNKNIKSKDKEEKMKKNNCKEKNVKGQNPFIDNDGYHYIKKKFNKKTRIM